MQPALGLDPRDNAAVESFFGLLKRERVNRVRYRTRDQARADVFDYIEVFYNRKLLATSARMTSKSGQPDLFELSTKTGQDHLTRSGHAARINSRPAAA